MKNYTNYKNSEKLHKIGFGKDKTSLVGWFSKPHNLGMEYYGIFPKAEGFKCGLLDFNAYDLETLLEALPKSLIVDGYFIGRLSIFFREETYCIGYEKEGEFDDEFVIEREAGDSLADCAAKLIIKLSKTESARGFSKKEDLEIYLDEEKTKKADFRISDDGFAILDKDLTYYVFGEKVYASGKAKVWAEGSAEVEAKDNVEVYAFGDAEVWAWDDVKVEAKDNVVVKAWGNVEVRAEGNVKVEAWGKVEVELNENASLIDKR